MDGLAIIRWWLKTIHYTGRFHPRHCLGIFLSKAGDSTIILPNVCTSSALSVTAQPLKNHWYCLIFHILLGTLASVVNRCSETRVWKWAALVAQLPRTSTNFEGASRVRVHCRHVTESNVAALTSAFSSSLPEASCVFCVQEIYIDM